MPVAAELALVGGALASDPGEQRGIEGVALRAVAALARASAPAFVLGRLFHREQGNLTTISRIYTDELIRPVILIPPLREKDPA